MPRRVLESAPEALTRFRSSPAALPPRRSAAVGSFLLAATANLAVFLHSRVRCATAVSSEPCPVLPWACLSTSKNGLFRPDLSVRPFGFRRCRGHHKQEPCQVSGTSKRRQSWGQMGNADPMIEARVCTSTHCDAGYSINRGNLTAHVPARRPESSEATRVYAPNA